MLPRTQRRPLSLGSLPRRRRAALAAALVALWLGAPSTLPAQPGSGAVAFEQLEAILPTPNVYRTATGEPGPQYWQQQVDYVIEVSLDEKAKRIEGSERITYRSHAPTPLRYLWVQLDQNRFRADSLARRSETAERRATTARTETISASVRCGAPRPSRTPSTATRSRESPTGRVDRWPTPSWTP